MKLLKIDLLIHAIDDDSFFLEIAKNELSKLNCNNLKSFTTSKEFFENLDKDDIPDVVLLDYWLGEETTGLQVLNELKKIKPNIYVIFLTSEEGMEIAENTIDHGAYDYVVKSDTGFLKIKGLLNRISHEVHLKQENRKIRNLGITIAAIVAFISILLFVLEKFVWRMM